MAWHHPVCDIDIIGNVTESNGYVPSGTSVFSVAAPPTSWTALDVSAGAPANSLAWLKVAIYRPSSGYGTSCRVRFRASDSSVEPTESVSAIKLYVSATTTYRYSLAIVPVGADGDIEWMVDGYTGTCPQIALEVVGYIASSDVTVDATGTADGSSTASAVGSSYADAAGSADGSSTAAATSPVVTSDAVTDGQQAFILEITGIASCFASVSDWTPHAADAWIYDGAGKPWYRIRPWLAPDGISVDEVTQFIEGTLDIAGLELVVVDVDAGMTALHADHIARASTRISQDISATDTTITVYSTASFGACGTIWLGLEAVDYEAKTATEFTGCTRGAYNTVARAYQADESIEPPVGVIVTDGAVDIRGRAARLYVCTRDRYEPTGYTPTTCIYRGHVSHDIPDIGEGVWCIPLEHVATVFGRAVGQALPQTPVMPGYFYSGSAWPGLSTIQWSNRNWLVASFDPFETTVDANLYASAEALMSDLNAQFLAAGADLTPAVWWSTADPTRVGIYVSGHSSIDVRITVREGDPLWALGFSAGTWVSQHGAPNEYQASDSPLLLVVDWSQPHGYSPRVEVENGAVLTTDAFVTVGENSFAQIGLITSNTISFYIGSQDRAHAQDYWSVEEEKDLVMRHVVATAQVVTGASDTIRGALERYLGLGGTACVEPAEWIAGGITSDDIDLDELDDATSGAPLQLLTVRDVVTESTPLVDLIGPRLGLLGVAPRITADGVIGFERITSAIWLESVGDLDRTVWSHIEATAVRSSLGADACVNQGIVQHSLDYRTGKRGTAIDITWNDGIAERGKTRAVSYDARGLVVVQGGLAGHADDVVELRSILVGWMTALHYGLYGRQSFTAQIPCTTAAKDFLVGDVVSVTHETLVDLGLGAIGTADRLATVVARMRSWTVEGTDVLTVRFGQRNRASGVAPAAKGTSWDVGSLTMTFADAATPLYAAAGGNDLDEFAAGMDVLLWAWDTESQPGGYPLAATIADVLPDGLVVVFDADPFSGAGMPASGAVVMTWPAWDDQDTGQQQWLAIADTDYGLGAAPDHAYEWGV